MTPATLRAVGQDMHRHACALIDQDPIAAAWWKGVALGRVAADQIRDADSFAREMGIQALRDVWGDAIPGAKDLADVTRRYFGLDAERRIAVAAATGMFRGFADATEEDPEAESCSWCDQRILRDVELLDGQRECVDHGFFCSDDCRADAGCS